MKLTVLVDNHTYINHYLLGEPAASYLIEDGDQTILFDTGYSEAFLENAKRMGIDLNQVTDIVLSHGHNDHTGGLPTFFNRFAQRVRIYAHPDALRPKQREGRNIGSPVSLEQLQAHADVRLITAPCAVSEHITFLGEIPRVHRFEEGRAVGETSCDDGEWVADTLRDDSSLALSLPDGLFVVTGCAHAGICNTVLYARQATGTARISGVFGGFHLFQAGAALDETIETLHAFHVSRVYPAHCTSLAVKCAFFREFETLEVGVGMALDWGTI